MQKEYVIQFNKTINKLLCNLSFAGQYITFFTGWHGRLSPRGNIVDRGGAEVDNAFQGVTIYHVIPERM